MSRGGVGTGSGVGGAGAGATGGPTSGEDPGGGSGGGGGGGGGSSSSWQQSQNPQQQQPGGYTPAIASVVGGLTQLPLGAGPDGKGLSTGWTAALAAAHSAATVRKRANMRKQQNQNVRPPRALYFLTLKNPIRKFCIQVAEYKYPLQRLTREFATCENYWTFKVVVFNFKKVWLAARVIVSLA